MSKIISGKRKKVLPDARAIEGAKGVRDILYAGNFMLDRCVSGWL